MSCGEDPCPVYSISTRNRLQRHCCLPATECSAPHSASPNNVTVGHLKCSPKGLGVGRPGSQMVLWTSVGPSQRWDLVGGV